MHSFCVFCITDKERCKLTKEQREEILYCEYKHCPFYEIREGVPDEGV
jgi:hypothetical protein